MDTKTREALAAAHEAAKAELDDLLEQQRVLRERTEEAVRLVRSLGNQLGVAPSDLPAALHSTETRVAAVRRVVVAARGPISPSEVREALALEGRPETIKAVSSALSYLASREEIASVGRGAWRAKR